MNDPAVIRFLQEDGWAGAPEELMVRRCTSLLEEARFRVPVDVRLLASMRGATVEEADQSDPGWMSWDGERLVIRVRSSDPEGRRRFTVCHEVCHTFFPDFRESPQARTDSQVERFDRRDPVEYLCDFGAAELLMPRDSFRWLMPERFTFDDVLRLADHFHAGIEASARRCVNLAEHPVAFVVLERTSGPLRVRYSVTNSLPEIPQGEELSEHDPLVHAIPAGATAYRGETALSPGVFEVSARYLPYNRDGESVDRILVLLQL